MKEVLRELLEKLDGLDWFIISGFAIEIYTEGKRKSNDIDLVVHEKDLEEFSKRVNARIKKRFFVKDNDYVVDDRAVEFEILGKEIEVTDGYPRSRKEAKSFQKLFDKKVKKSFEGFDLFVAPIEEILVHKAIMKREKDLNDLQLLKCVKFDKDFLIEIAEDCNAKEKVLNVLNEQGYGI